MIGAGLVGAWQLEEYPVKHPVRGLRLALLGILFSISITTADSAFAVAGRSLSDVEVARAKASALSGNGNDAQALSAHFAIAGDTEETNYWFRIAVENEDPYAMQEFAAKLWMKGGERNCARARFFIDKAVVAASAAATRDARFLELAIADRDSMNKSLAECISRVPAKDSASTR